MQSCFRFVKVTRGSIPYLGVVCLTKATKSDNTCGDIFINGAYQSKPHLSLSGNKRCSLFAATRGFRQYARGSATWFGFPSMISIPSSKVRSWALILSIAAREGRGKSAINLAKLINQLFEKLSWPMCLARFLNCA